MKVLMLVLLLGLSGCATVNSVHEADLVMRIVNADKIDVVVVGKNGTRKATVKSWPEAAEFIIGGSK